MDQKIADVAVVIKINPCCFGAMAFESDQVLTAVHKILKQIMGTYNKSPRRFKINSLK